MCVLYLDSNMLLNMFCKHFSPSLSVTFWFLNGVFEMWKFLILIKSSISLRLWFVLSVSYVKFLPRGQWSFFPVFSSTGFVAVDVSNSELVFLMLWVKGQVYLFFIWMSKCSNTICWTDYPPTYWIALVSCWKLIWHIWMVHFSVLSSVSSFYMSIFIPILS